MNKFKKIWNKIFNIHPDFPPKPDTMSQLDYDIDKRLYEMELEEEKDMKELEYLLKEKEDELTDRKERYKLQDDELIDGFEKTEEVKESANPSCNTSDVLKKHNRHKFSTFITSQYNNQRNNLKSGDFSDDEILKTLGTKEEYINNLLNNPDEIEKFNNHTDIKPTFEHMSSRKSQEEKKVELKRIAEEYKEKAKIEIPKLQAARSKSLKKKKASNKRKNK